MLLVKVKEIGPASLKERGGKVIAFILNELQANLKVLSELSGFDDSV
jgi:hypothetical protein